MICDYVNCCIVVSIRNGGVGCGYWICRNEWIGFVVYFLIYFFVVVYGIIKWF